MRIAGILLLFAGVQYAVLEYLAASAWHHPTYSYAVNFIGDLGNSVAGDVFEGRVINSPWHVAMNVAFVAQGLLFLAASVLLLGKGTGRLERALLVLAIVHGAGVILIGFFHESSAALYNGVLVVHGIGADATILAGNIIPLVIGAKGGQLGAPGWMRKSSTALGILGLAAFVLLQVDRPLYHAAGGVPERAAVYTILMFEVMAGAAHSRALGTRYPSLLLPTPLKGSHHD